MKNMILLGFLALASREGQSAETADEILKKADEIRAPSDAYRMEVTVESPAEKSLFRFELNIGGKDASLIRTLEPSREVGKNFLMLQEEMWAYIPNIKRSIRVTLNQKLTGQASNGDISRMRWYGDYEAVLEGQDEQAWQLLLTAKKRGLTYEKIRVWVLKSNYRPERGEYLSSEAKPLKFVQFTEFKEFAGALRPSRIVIQNAHKKDDFSVLEIKSMKQTKFPDSFFTQNNLSP
jgi:hypothetical protein